MMKINLMLITCIMGILVVFLAPVSAQKVGYNYEIRENKDGSFTATIFSNYVYYFDGKGWERINESFGTKDCIPNTGITQYSYCQSKDNLYKTHFKDSLQENKTIAFDKGGESLYLEFTDFLLDGKSIFIPGTKPIIDNNVISYDIFKDKYWVEYVYTPTILKETFYIDDEIIKKLDFKGIELKFKKYDANKYAIFAQNFTVCDYEGWYCDSLKIDIQGDILTVYVPPLKWMVNATLPLVIDPTISINDTFWDGSVYHQGAIGMTWARENTTQMGNVMLFGESGRIGVVKSRWSYESDIDYNLSYFEDLGDLTGLEIQEILFYYNVTQRPLNNWGFTFNFSINEMEKHPASVGYADTEAGNLQFWNDISNGTTWNLSYDVSIGTKIANLTNGATTQLQNLLLGGTYNWSIGLFLDPHERFDFSTQQMGQMKIAGKAYPIASSRHYINITYVIVPPAPTAVVFPPAPDPFFWVYYDLLVWVLCISLVAGFLLYSRL